MANQEHLDILKQGVETWNQWREKDHYDTRPDLSYADLRQADLMEAQLQRANLRRARLNEANLSNARLSEANLSGAKLWHATLIETNLSKAILTQCSIYGISAWDIQLEGAKQENLVITPPDEPIITVDNLEVAQFIYLLLNNPKIRDVINTIGQKGVLILGRFTPERKAVLDAIRPRNAQRACITNPERLAKP